MRLSRNGPAGQERTGLPGKDGKVCDLSSLGTGKTGTALNPAWLHRTGLAEESGMGISSEPVIFNKRTLADTGLDDGVRNPCGAVKTDREGELAVAVGKTGTHVEEENALLHDAWFCVVNDGSEHEYQTERTGTWDEGNGCDAYGCTRPQLVTLGEVGDYDDFKMWCEVGGHRHRHGTTTTMICKVPHLRSYCSRFGSLQRGNVISTGTPSGVGMGKTAAACLKGGR